MTSQPQRLYPYRWTPPLDVLAEVDALARARGIGRPEALLALVRSGLDWARAEREQVVRLDGDF